MAILITNFIGFETNNYQELYGTGGTPALDTGPNGLHSGSYLIQVDNSELIEFLIDPTGLKSGFDMACGGGYFRFTSVSPVADVSVCRIYEDDDSTSFPAWGIDSSGHIIAMDAGGSKTATSSQTLSTGTDYKIEWWFYQNNTTGRMRVDVNGTTWIDNTNQDTDNGGTWQHFQIRNDIGTSTISIDDLYCGADNAGSYSTSHALNDVEWEIPGYYQAQSDSAYSGDAPDTGTISDLGENPLNETNACEWQPNPASCDFWASGGGVGPLTDITGTVINAKYWLRADRDGGGGTTHTLWGGKYESGVGFTMDSITPSIGTSPDDYWIFPAVAYCPTTTSHLGAWGIDISGNQDLWIYEAGMWVLQTVSAGYELPIDPGTYSHTGTDVDLLWGHDLPITPGTYSITGTDVGLNIGRQIPIDPGTYATTGTDVQMLWGRNLPLDPGVHSHTGTDVGLLWGHVLPIDPGVYTCTGTDVGLNIGLQITITPGVYSHTGTDIDFLWGHVIPIAPGAYSITGTAIDLLWGHVIPIAPGVYTYTGTDVELIKGGNKVISIEPGVYTVTGTDVQLLWGHVIPITPGVYTYTGTDVTLAIGLKIDIIPGSYNHIGTDVQLLWGHNLPITPGVYIYTGTDVNFYVGLVMIITPGNYSYIGTDVDPLWGHNLPIVPGSYIYTGTDVGLSVGRVMVIIPGSYIITGTDIEFLQNRIFTLDAGVYVYTGTDVVLEVGFTGDVFATIICVDNPAFGMALQDKSAYGIIVTDEEAYEL